MKIATSLLVALIACSTIAVRGAEIPAPLRDVHRIVFLGDSITQGGDYVTDFECWLLSQGINIEVIDLGLSSETASDLTAKENEPHKTKHGFGRPEVSERLARALSTAKPDLLVVCYGMNDGDNLPAGDEGTKRFAKACEYIDRTARNLGVKHVTFCTPPMFDARGAKSQHEDNIAAYAGWLLTKRSADWDVTDIHGPMVKALAEARAKDPSFKFAGDGVHPGREGHWLMAREILTQSFGAKLDGVNSADQLFASNGNEIRKLVNDRRGILFSAYMTRIGHKRPGVPGGPGVKPGPSIDEANAKAADIAKQIAAKLGK